MIGRNKKLILPIISLLIVIGLVGYAYLNKQLTITGQTTVTKTSWSVKFTTITPIKNTGTLIQTPTITDDTELTFSEKLNHPGDEYIFTVDVENKGTIDAMLNGTPTLTGLENMSSYLQYKVTYKDGAPIEDGNLLAKGEKDTLRVTLKFKKDITAQDIAGLSEADVTKRMVLTMNYVQANENASERRYASFATDSWSTIVENVSIGNGGVYAPKAGEEVLREVTLTGFSGTHYLRVANTTDCTNGETSETACGFVVEFADIITTHTMNSNSSGSTIGTGNNGGWKNSEMRTYVNSDIYNALPSEIKNSIKKTKVISSHGKASGDDQNLESEDFLYLLSPKEVWNDGTSYDTTENTTPPTTRQLDYYSVNGVTLSNYGGVIKKQDNNTSASNWWLRSAGSGTMYTFFFVRSDGIWSSDSSTVTYGVSPAFRIGD